MTDAVLGSFKASQVLVTNKRLVNYLVVSVVLNIKKLPATYSVAVKTKADHLTWFGPRGAGIKF